MRNGMPWWGWMARVHDKVRGFSTEKVAKDHPDHEEFSPISWQTKGDELYNTVKMMPTATALPDRPIAPPAARTTLSLGSRRLSRHPRLRHDAGHNMTTGADPSYHKLLAYGILWACGKLDGEGKPVEGYGASGTHR